MPKEESKCPHGFLGALHNEKLVDDTRILSSNTLIESWPISSFPTSVRQLSIIKFKLSLSTFVYEKWPLFELWHFVQQNFR